MCSFNTFTYNAYYQQYSNENAKASKKSCSLENNVLLKVRTFAAF